MSMQIKRFDVDDIALLANPLAEVPADEKIRFALNGTEYEIDLADKNARGFWKAIKPYRDAARRVKSPRRSRPTATRVNSAKAREWAREQGYDIKDHGRLPEDIIAKYQAATREQPAA